VVHDVCDTEKCLSYAVADVMNRSEAASIDKMMHALDYERALGELLELDDTVRATIAREFLPFTEVWFDWNVGWTDLKEIGEYDDTLILVTADHGHGFVNGLRLLARLMTDCGIL
jgi:alkaline phosphatase